MCSLATTSQKTICSEDTYWFFSPDWWKLKSFPYSIPNSNFLHNGYNYTMFLGYSIPNSTFVHNDYNHTMFLGYLVNKIFSLAVSTAVVAPMTAPWNEKLNLDIEKELKKNKNADIQIFNLWLLMSYFRSARDTIG